MRGELLAQELRMTDPMVMAGVVKWCWSRLQGGVVGWDAYELFKVGEHDSSMARDAFTTFIPLSVEDEARSRIITDFFDLLSAVAAHGKSNGFGGRKLSRMASWWAFEYKDTGNGFEGGYKHWLMAADATSHLFFAYLRALAPQPNRGGISMLPMSLQKLLQETEYPPQRPALMQSTTNRVVMIVDSVSPTPFALLRRANHFQYRQNDRALQEYADYEDPVQALTEECRRVLMAISLANQSQISSSKHSTGLRDASWSRFEDIGFGGGAEDAEDEEATRRHHQAQARDNHGLRTSPASGDVLGGRPTTPSWADFLSSGFVNDGPASPSLLLPPDKILPPIDANIRQKSSQSHNPRLESTQYLEPGELANILRFDLDDAFWWVWMSSLAPEETPERKAAFGRCAVIETIIRSGRWLVMEEMVKGTAPEPDAGAYVAEKKGLFSWTKRNKDKGVSRSKSTGKGVLEKSGGLQPNGSGGAGYSKTSIGPDQQAKIQAAAQQLQAKQHQEDQDQLARLPVRRGRTDAELMKEKTNSVLTLQPVIMKEASPAMKWANKYDKDAIREMYLGNMDLGRGLGQATMPRNGHSDGNSPSNGSLRPDHAMVSPPLSPQPQPSPGLRQTHDQSGPMSPAGVPAEDSSPDMAPVSEKAPEDPRDVHPLERPGATGRDSPLPPPPQDKLSAEVTRSDMYSPEPSNLKTDGKKPYKKLHKDEKKPSGGLRKLFGRNKNRTSKLPDNAATDVNSFLAQKAAAPEHRPEPIRSESAATIERPPVQPSTPTTRKPVPPPSPAPAPAPAPEASADDVSRTDTADAAEAHQEFSRFDQGPLADQPAFAPEEDVSEDEYDDALPPPIARGAGSQEPDRDDVESDDEESAPPPAVPMQDRWAQIRKNAADRARGSEEQSRGGYSKATTDGDDDTSGEESECPRTSGSRARRPVLTRRELQPSSPVSPGSRLAWPS